MRESQGKTRTYRDRQIDTNRGTGRQKETRRDKEIQRDVAKKTQGRHKKVAKNH